ncbi:MAG: CehA/McbA family metallohydrolase [Chloroflexi bacterium]|nr:CehA/McbA family metallohydrolase [Chloroflexota bacterium]
MPKITGEVRDASTGEVVQARVQVLAPNGANIAPVDAMWKVGSGEPFFYSDGQFSIETTRGYHRVLVERGTEFTPWVRTIEVDGTSDSIVDIQISRWADLPDRGWHPGNTHIHYDEKETNPDRRLAYDSRVEDLRMTAVSILKRWDLDYATNKYPPGVLNEFTDTHHHVQSGEETRHNHDPSNPFQIGYGHVMLLNIRNQVDPISRGHIVDQFDPDYPPLSYACDVANDQDGLVIWCHNGQGMEAPVAAALGKVHAMNLFDPFWTDIEYFNWYHMLNTGIKLPASTGSDWFLSSANRVYSQTNGGFEYESWLDGIRNGRTFITNGPALFLTVAGHDPGQTLEVEKGTLLHVHARWDSHYSVDRVEIVVNGAVVARRDFPEGSTSGHLEAELVAGVDGWIAVRLGSGSRDSFNQPIWAHTSPVYVTGTGTRSDASVDSAKHFADRIDEGIHWVKTKGRFYNDSQRKEVVDLFRQGQEWYRNLK